MKRTEIFEALLSIVKKYPLSVLTEHEEEDNKPLPQLFPTRQEETPEIILSESFTQGQI